ncbi:uncharacterized protein KD926_010931 [Aspergillus affinis]|uniref:uncharacterized protein n=1 Tax=Aspergillus affinis TaxID=1070780 RepID=UPI0022FE56B3|nr:uncharacterized protein KD926_010931 [Aspergillus affinis]KAI9038275.1 hypothetical protein KD926_010931 [Aspergillus affinis]
MALTPSTLSKNIFSAFAILLLTTWTLTALAFTALNVLNTNSTYISSIASISLLTFLLARLLVISHPTTGSGTGTHDTESIAHILTSAHRRSRKEALLLFTLTCTWFYELLCKVVLLFFMTVFGGVVATIIYNDPEGLRATDNMGSAQGGQQDDDAGTTALAEIDQFKTRAGVDFDPSVVFMWIPPRMLVYFAVLVWVNFVGLGVYVLRYAWRALRRVVREEGSASSVPVVVEKADGR